MKSVKTTTYINSRKARFEYFIDDTYRAGLVLTGSEVKSIKAGHANIGDAYCYFIGNELFLKNAHITSQNNLMFSHDELRDRKLLLKKKELKSLMKAVQVKGITIIPLSIEIPVHGYIKINIAVCRGKHNYDKRQTIRENDYKKELERINKSR